MISRRRLIVLTFLVLLGCGRDSSELRRELSRESAKNGLAVAEIGQWIAVLPFDGPQRYFESKYGYNGAYVGKAGTIFVWWSPFAPFVLERVEDGAVISERKLPYGVSLQAVDENADRLTFYVGGTEREPTISLRWASLDFSQSGVVTPQIRVDEVQEVGWSPGGKVLAYESSGQIYLFDTTNNSSKLLIQGHDPTWSPDGKWIAYRSLDQFTSLVTPDGTRVDWPGGKHEIERGSRWSPDGRYVIFSEDVPHPIPVIGAYYRLVVCRMSDGATVAVRDFGADSIHVNAFRWILNYRTFCANCKAREPFN